MYTFTRAKLKNKSINTNTINILPLGGRNKLTTNPAIQGWSPRIFCSKPHLWRGNRLKKWIIFFCIVRLFLIHDSPLRGTQTDKMCTSRTYHQHNEYVLLNHWHFSKKSPLNISKKQTNKTNKHNVKIKKAVAKFVNTTRSQIKFQVPTIRNTKRIICFKSILYRITKKQPTLLTCCLVVVSKHPFFMIENSNILVFQTLVKQYLFLAYRPLFLSLPLKPNTDKVHIHSWAAWSDHCIHTRAHMHTTLSDILAKSWDTTATQVFHIMRCVLLDPLMATTSLQMRHKFQSVGLTRLRKQFYTM